MRDADIAELKNNTKLVRCIKSQAWRYFGRSEADRDDAESAAWERLCKQPAGLSLEDCKRQAQNAMRCLYDKISTRRKREQAFDPTEAGAEPSAALHALAQAAIDGDW